MSTVSSIAKSPLHSFTKAYTTDQIALMDNSRRMTHFVVFYNLAHRPSNQIDPSSASLLILFRSSTPSITKSPTQVISTHVKLSSTSCFLRLSLEALSHFPDDKRAGFLPLPRAQPSPDRRQQVPPVSRLFPSIS